MLFHKRTRKAIKYVWGAFSLVIILSMVLTYSGVLYLTSSPADINQNTSVEEALARLTPEERAALEAQMNTDASGTPLTFTPVGTNGEKLSPEVREKIEQELRQIPPPVDTQQTLPAPTTEPAPVPTLNFNVPE